MTAVFKGPQFYNEDDHSIFKGREVETKDLLYIVEHSDFSVCYAVSGEGKSSLINAGLCPKLREHSFLPIHIKNITNAEVGRFDEYVWKQIKDSVSNEQKKERYTGLAMLKIEPKPKSKDLYDSVWWKLRTREFRINSYEMVMPVLIFDQFEEVFSSSKDLSWTDAFFCWLEKLYQDDNLENAEYNGRFQKKFKVLFSLRSEYVCELDYWSMNKYFIPSLKNNRYYLKPLRKGAAMEIAKQIGQVSETLKSEDIVKHATSERAGEWDKINEDLPCVSALILSLILTGLCEKNAEVEKRINQIINSVNEGKELFDFLLENVYDRALLKCGVPHNNEVISYIEELEDKLIDVNGKRRHVSEEELPAISNENIRNALNTLRNERILNVVDKHYEISHDTLCEVVSKKRNKRKYESERKRLCELAEEKAKLKRVVIHKEYWTDSFFLFPITVFLCLAVYILLSAVLNEISFVFFDKTLPVEEQLNHGKHLFCNILMFLLAFSNANLLVFFLKKIRGVNVRVYSILLLLLSFLACLWHKSDYIPQHEEIFRLIDGTVINNYIWPILYAGLISIPMILTILLFVTKHEMIIINWKDLLLMRKMVVLRPAKIYSIVLLFVALYACVLGEQMWRVSSGESAFLILFVGLQLHSLFSRRGIWNKRWKYYIPTILLSFGLWLHDGECLFFLSPKVAKAIHDNLELYLLIIWCVYCLTEFLSYKQNLNKRSNLIFAYTSTILIMGLSSLFYIGFLPWNKNKPAYPIYRNLDKWRYFISQKDSLYGACTVNGELLVPFMFDKSENKNLMLFIKEGVLLSSRIDSLLWTGTGAESVTNCSSVIYRKQNVMELKVPNLFICLSNLSKQDQQTKTLSNKSYMEILESIICRLKEGKPMNSNKLDYTEELIKMEHQKADFLFEAICKRDTTKTSNYLSSDSVTQYFESVTKEISLLTIKDLAKSNSIFSINLLLLEMGFSYNYPEMVKWKCSTSSNTNINYNVCVDDTIQIELHNTVGWNAKLLSEHDFFYWQQKIEGNIAVIRQALLTELVLGLLDIEKNLPALIKKTHKTIDEVSKGRYERLIEHSDEILTKVIIGTSHPELHQLCKHRINQIDSIIGGTAFSFWGKQIKRDLMILLLHSDLTDTKEMKNTIELANNMQDEDINNIRKEYDGIIKIHDALSRTRDLGTKLEKTKRDMEIYLSLKEIFEILSQE